MKASSSIGLLLVWNNILNFTHHQFFAVATAFMLVLATTVAGKAVPPAAATTDGGGKGNASPDHATTVTGKGALPDVCPSCCLSSFVKSMLIHDPYISEVQTSELEVVHDSLGMSLHGRTNHVLRE
jgi:hypothetical protein